RLFNVVFCRECGQEYLPVWAQGVGNTVESLDPRELGETRSDDDETSCVLPASMQEMVFRPC
ncbi:hypothetical protein, partial [Acidiferrobacter sp.]|uniref:hypothetical protein n=1 Tax=Acidiferrobacter sp. TaxID=1872107 RepID=UPI0026045907